MSDLTSKVSVIADHLKSGKKVTFFQGAGVSTGAGIPDFRSPKTGLYSNLARLNLPYAEAVFDIDYFKEKPKAFYTLADELYPGKFQPTSFHYLVRIVQDKGLLKRVYTQNIDTLERVAGVKDEYIVEAHGSFSRNHCIGCGEEMTIAELKSFMADDKIPTCKKCLGYVKPDIVFFGESLPARFFEAWDEDSSDVEFAIVAGTSLTVYPFAGLPSSLPRKTPRVLINKETVGDFSPKKKSDTIILEDCDKVAEELCKLMGWEDELHKLKKAGYSFGVEDEIKEITKEMDRVLGEKPLKPTDENSKGSSDEVAESEEPEAKEPEAKEPEAKEPEAKEPVPEAKEPVQLESATKELPDEDIQNKNSTQEKSVGAKLLEKLGNLKI